ncbi:MAG TPA: Uma2 family endonuclease [Fimbriiglobus sp.]|nr:Uma2 family endonuclease [Fimbriiglobus sp.]
MGTTKTPITPPITSEQLFAMPGGSKMERWLIRGELRERRMTKRNPNHAGATAAVTILLGSWLQGRPKPRGRVYNGDVYFRLRTDPETNVGVDVAYADAELVAATPKKAKFLDGHPVLAVEVLSPHDKNQEIAEKVEEYLACGVKLVWVIDPFPETVTVYRPDRQPELFNVGDTLTAEPHLPGLAISVADIFE